MTSLMTQPITQLMNRFVPQPESLPINHVLGILSDNLRLRGSVMPLSTRKATAWADGLNLPKTHETVLYTGHMYQLMPATESLSRMMTDMEATKAWPLRFMGAGRTVNSLVNTTRFMAKPDPASEAVFNRRLANIARLLKTAGVSFGYLYGQELYAGALLYDQGVDDVFADHARTVWNMLKKNGVRNVITVDPHTTHMLRHVYPDIIPKFNIQVKSYLEVLAGSSIAPTAALKDNVVIHDACVYARYENIINQPRVLMDKAGLSFTDVENSGAFTHCCGGPIESLFPRKAKAIAETRASQLTASGCKTIVSMCPICLMNLDHAVTGNGTRVTDISDILFNAYGGASA